MTSSSRYLDYDGHDVPSEVIKFADQFAVAHKKIFPLTYVVDVAVEKEKGPLVIECNPLSSPGRYVNNDFASFLKVVSSGVDAKKLDFMVGELEKEDKVLLEKQARLPVH